MRFSFLFLSLLEILGFSLPAALDRSIDLEHGSMIWLHLDHYADYLEKFLNNENADAWSYVGGRKFVEFFNNSHLLETIFNKENC